MKKISRRSFLVAAGSAAVALGLSGCGASSSAAASAASGAASGAASSADKPVTLRVYMQYSSDDEKQPYDYAVNAMKEEMPNVSLDLEIMAQDDNQKLKTYAATNNLPDIFCATTDIIESFKKSNNILALDDYAEAFGVKDQLLASAQNLLYNADGHIYAIPDAGQFAALIYYNKQVFADCGVEEPTNYDEFLAAVKAIKAKGIVPLALFGKEKWEAVQLFDMLASRENPNGIKDLDTATASASDDAYVHAAEKMIELVQNGLLPNDVFNISSDDAIAMLENNQAAMYLSGAWSLSTLGSEMGDNVSYMYCPLASAENASTVAWNLSGGGYNSGIGVNPNSKNVDIAAEFVCKFALAFAKGRIIKRGDPNPILVEENTPETPYSAIQQKYVDDSAKFQTMTCYDWGLTDSVFKAGIEDETNKLLTGTYTVEEFTQNLQASIGQQ
jgi:raffinose/stachyose/melibiose transport system substrate-binding protein